VDYYNYTIPLFILSGLCFAVWKHYESYAESYREITGIDINEKEIIEEMIEKEENL